MKSVLILFFLLKIHNSLCEYKSSESHSVFFDKHGNEFIDNDKKYFKLNGDEKNEKYSDEFKRDEYKRDEYKRDEYNRDEYKRDEYNRDEYKRDEYKRDEKREFDENEYRNDKFEYTDDRKEDSKDYERYGKDREYNEFYDDDKKDYYKDGLYVGNPDDFGKIVRPCQNYDIYCIRKFFAEHSYCKIARGPVPDPLFRAENTLYLPRINTSLIDTNFYISGLNGRVEEFYVDPVTDNLVIAIQFTNLSININNTYFVFYKRAREPVVTLASTGVTFPSLTVTGVIPHINHLELEKADVNGYSDSAFPPFYITPSAAESSDPQVQFALAEFLKNIPTDVQEVLLTKSPFYFGSYIQYNICDFKLKDF